MEEEKRRRYEKSERQEKEEQSKPVLVIDAESVSSANSITVYVDGNRVCTVSGGSRKTVKISAGYHTVKTTVYNDASESYYVLNESSNYFESYKDYTIDLH